MCSAHQLSNGCSVADDNYGIFDLLDSNDTTSPLEPVTDPNTIAEYPNLGDEASCTSNCLFKRSKDDVSVTSGTKEYNDFTDTVALWGLSGVDATSTSTAVSDLITFATLLRCVTHSSYLLPSPHNAVHQAQHLQALHSVAFSCSLFECGLKVCIVHDLQNILRNDLTQTRQEFRIDRQAANIIVNQHGRDYNYNLYAGKHKRLVYTVNCMPSCDGSELVQYLRSSSWE